MKSYSVSFDVPEALWMTTLSGQSVQRRRDIRRVLRRRLGASVWRDAKTRGATHVTRFMLAVTIGFPDGWVASPVLGAETLKPLIDAGTDVGLWPDDDPFHRVATCYLRDPRPATPGTVRISMMILPLGEGERAPGCVVGRACGARGVARMLTVRDRDWLTSNMREPPDVRQVKQSRIMGQAAPLWMGFPLSGGLSVMCGVRYPDRRRKYLGDPDNTAETATAMWGAGVVNSILPAEPGLFGFFLLPGQSRPHTHDLAMLVFETPDQPWPKLLTQQEGGV